MLLDKCPGYDELDKLLGTRPTVRPVDIVESYSYRRAKTPSPPSSYSEEVKLDKTKVCVLPKVMLALLSPVPGCDSMTNPLGVSP